MKSLRRVVVALAVGGLLFWVAAFALSEFVIAISPAQSKSQPPLQMSQSEHLSMYQRYAITWTIPYPAWGESFPKGVQPGLFYRQLRGKLQTQLTNPNGWQRTGMQFVYTPSIATANIVFYAVANDKVFSDCESDVAVACEEFISPGHCNIYLGYGVNYLGTTIREYYEPREGIVNHEIGHCFGFNHTRYGLMNINSPIEFPSAQLVRFVQHEMHRPNETFGSGKAQKGGK